MSDLLDFVVDGMKVRETDLSVFRTTPSLREWRKRAGQVWRETNPTLVGRDPHLEMFNALDALVTPMMDQMSRAAEDRKMSLPWRNQGLVVIPRNEGRVETMNYEIGTNTAQNLFYQGFDCFTRAEQMTAYEFDAYDTLGDEMCDRQGIETLHDMFGTDWAERFYRRKNLLITRSQLHALYDERDDLNTRIVKLEASERDYS
jgi:hypothetical protein